MWLWSQVREGTHQPVIGWQPHRNSWFLTHVCVWVCVYWSVCVYTHVHIHLCVYMYLCVITVLVQSPSRVYLRPHELQHIRLPCPSLYPWVCSNSRPLNQQCHLTILSSVVPFSSCPQYFPVYICVCIKSSQMKSLSRVRLFATPWTIGYQAPPSMGLSRQEHWSGLPFPSPGDLPDPGIEPGSPALQADALTSEPPGKPMCMSMSI